MFHPLQLSLCLHQKLLLPQARLRLLHRQWGEGSAAFRMALRALHKKIQSEFTNVGDKFAEEARKIQEGASQEQNIYGTCTEEEQRELSEAGIDILPLPELPPEH